MTDEVVNALSVDGLSYSYRLLRQPAQRIEPVLILGGLLQGKDGWEHFEEPVLPLTSLITIDLPGSGKADPIRDDQGMDTLCRAVEQVLDDLSIVSVNLFGYSYGSAIGFAFAQRHPHRVARLLLGGVPVEVTSMQLDTWRKAATRVMDGRPGEFVELTLNLWLCQDERRYVRHRRLARRYVKRLLTHAVANTTHGFTILNRAATEGMQPSGELRGVPALVFCGEHDTVSAPEKQRAFAANVENCRFLTITECDHWLPFERSQDVVDLVVRFFTDQPVEGAHYAAQPEARAEPAMR
ncbi:alpha/beta fold hydrolase [Streptomyces sp. NPDC001339]|uniref:alpha/beta fold hydrolase n=1 Tax=Streptomyces sp. NPDC001339 TaxID=3364563 RepID=UPI0036A6B3E7